MTHDENSNPNETGVSRRATLTLAAVVAALGVALGMRSSAFAQGKGEGKMDGKAEGKAEGKGEGKGEGKFEGKEGRREGKGGRIKVDIATDGTASVDVKCAEDESMKACADLTKEIIDKVKGTPPR